MTMFAFSSDFIHQADTVETSSSWKLSPVNEAKSQDKVVGMGAPSFSMTYRSKEEKSHKAGNLVFLMLHGVKSKFRAGVDRESKGSVF